jgi:hypothetical protein
MRQAIYVFGVMAGFQAGIAFVAATVPAAGPSRWCATHQGPLQVHVVGAVLRPGVYILLEAAGPGRCEAPEVCLPKLTSIL